MKQIWTVFTGFAAILGVITSLAVFFPDAFDLTKRPFPVFEKGISNQSDMEQFKKFVETNRGEIARIKLNFCSDAGQSKSDGRYWWLSLGVNSSPTVITWISQRSGSREATECLKASRETGVSRFETCQADQIRMDGLAYFRNYPCPDGTGVGGYQASGYYYIIEEARIYRGIEVSVLEQVSEKDVRLKRYK